MRLQQRHLAIQAKLDRAYEDRLRGVISEDLWLQKSRDWQEELELVRSETDEVRNWVIAASRGGRFRSQPERR